MATTLDLKSKEEKDAELDKRIEALRKKNAALIRRYQEIEEDRKKAELEGVAVTGPRKGRPAEKENVAVDMEKSVGSGRRPPASARAQGSSGKGGRNASQRGGRPGLGRGSRYWEEEVVICVEPPPARSGGGRGRRGRGRGGPAYPSGTSMAAGDAPAPDRRSKEWEERRRQNIEKMNEEMEKIAEYERNQRDGLPEKNPVRNFLDDPRRSGPLQESERDRREGSRRHGRNWGGADFERVRSGLEQERYGRRAGPGGDMTLSMTGRERAEYLRWKQERERIDQERLQRHRKPTGQWRREWDAEKTEGMFKDGPSSVSEAPTHHGETWGGLLIPGPQSDGYGEKGGREDLVLGWGGGRLRVFSLPSPFSPQTEGSSRTPQTPTFGDFLPQHKTVSGSRRRRKTSRPRAKGPPRGYSHHDDRWEPKEEEEEVPVTPQEKPPVPEPQPQPPSAAPEPSAPEEGPATAEEDEDQWEDVSGEDEEGEDEEDGDSGEEEEEEEEVETEEEEDEEEEEEDEQQAGASGSGQAPGPKQGSPVEDRAESQPAPASAGSPFSPSGGHQPVSDWGEEMEQSSPRATLSDAGSSPGATPPGAGK
ncbi:LOW QUALITY PROTEIN: coiled-coil domain-containing protein 9 [Dromiciops gliroides]|uniref:LOW QUALITY PROTEIN: coiled-coil domain-containing protein 9 n=1 Tax=Dromiciops gliroides TaxID=33562 RepID=UPI001CC82171|nr:LOW QUALITY PROTEIN: coiled-coil domain-containing protein 9 [Dromiciops gliroides]